uniref:Uncharacterized protein n=1 Tax=Leersia perrieri TaxID=77586 RepID=A0A0D9UVV2_9ORYZ
MIMSTTSSFREQLLVLGEALLDLAADVSAAARAMDHSTVISLACAAVTVAIVLLCYVDICARLAAIHPPPPSPEKEADPAPPPLTEEEEKKASIDRIVISDDDDADAGKERSVTSSESPRVSFAAAFHVKEEPFAVAVEVKVKVKVKVKQPCVVGELKLVVSLLPLNR